MNRTAICLDKSSMYILKKCKWNSPSGGVVGHAEDGKAVGPLDVEDVAVLRVGHVAVVRAGDLLEDLSRDGAGVRLSGAEFRQDD